MKLEDFATSLASSGQKTIWGWEITGEFPTEFLLLGVRGRLRFRDRAQSSWMLCRRTIHSRKPEAVRMLVEKVSPGPYLELYGRAELPNSAWTVYGNRVERRLF